MNISVRVIRSERNEHGTFGQMLFPEQGGLFAALHTCEDDWLNNQRGVSCIPSGEYRLMRTIYYKHGYETFEVVGVQGRSRILIHPGNTEEDTDGCILVGIRRGKLWVPDEDSAFHTLTLKDAVVDSRAAFGRFMDIMSAVDEARISVEWAPGLP